MHYVTTLQTNADPLLQASSLPQYCRVAIGIGSNLGHPQTQIERGLRAIQSHPHIEIVRLSPFYWTTPVYQHEPPSFPHPPYLNGAAILDTQLTPPELMQACLQIEADLGRVRSQHWSPRPLDLDLLLWECQRLDLPTVKVPHPRMGNRAFVLVPLAHLVPDWSYPLPQPHAFYPSIAELAARIGCEGVDLEHPEYFAVPATEPHYV